MEKIFPNKKMSIYSTTRKRAYVPLQENENMPLSKKMSICPPKKTMIISSPTRK